MNKKIILYLAVIIGVTTFIYTPSFQHILRGEMYTYFMDSLGCDSAISLISNYYNYEMVRVFDAGDSLVFRPLLFTVLGIETAMFGDNYTWWHIAGLVMHLTAALCLFRLLWRIRPTVIVLFATLLFSTSMMVLNTILYVQINSYALFTAAILTTLYYVYCGIESGRIKHLVLAGISMLIACFFLEFGIILTGLFIIYFWLERKNVNFKWKRWCLVFIVIFAIYCLCYVGETFGNPTTTTHSDLGKLLSWERVNYTIFNGQELGKYWVKQTILPTNFTTGIDTYLRANPVNIVEAISPIMLMCNIGAVIVLMASLFIKRRLNGRVVSTPFLLLLTVAPITLIYANAFYRGATHNYTYFQSDANYNIYIFTAMFILLVYSFISSSEFTKKHLIAISLSLSILILFNAPLVFRLNYAIAEDVAPIRAYYQEIDNFIDLHRQDYRPEDDRSFTFNSIINDSSEEARLEILLWKGTPGADDYTPYTFTMTEVLYWNYWDNVNPKYILIYHSEKGELEVIEND